MPTELDQRAVSVIRGLAMDAPHAARSGHQGTAMALAPLAHVLWSRVLCYDATDPDWPDRDRFILSAGHASILLYSMLHLTGHGLDLDDLRAFRQWGSRTPGHPEVGHAPGVEVTTGPLGQGFANAVGMALAERWLRARFGAELCDHRTFVVAGDGDLSEGLSHEAASLAGHQRLGRLVAVYDDNHISIDGRTELALSDDAAMRFRAYGWHVIELGDAADDLDALEAGLREAAAHEEAPSLVIVRSRIGHPATRSADTPGVHGYAIFEEEIAETKRVLGLPEDQPFWVPEDVLDWYRDLGARGRADRKAWEARLAAASFDREAWEACLAGGGLAGWQEKLPVWAPGGKPVATRKANAACMEAVLDVVPGMVGGGADLTGNTGTTIAGQGVMSAEDPGGRQLFFGVREHAMGAVANGMALHGGTLPVVGTFLVFADYMRPAVRLAALSGARVIFVWSHDSVGVGEDGPTHQPVEHLASLRAIPGLRTIRPADANETAHAWRLAVDLPGPTALVLTRQDVPVLDGTAAAATGVARGAYVLRDGGGEPDVVLVGTGSEVAVCVDAAALLAAEGICAWVVSMPCWELFEALDDDAQDEVLPQDVPTLAVEAGVGLGWDLWADDVVSIERFGASAPGEEVLSRFGYTAEAVRDRALALLED